MHTSYDNAENKEKNSMKIVHLFGEHIVNRTISSDWWQLIRQWPILQTQLKFKSIIFSSISNAVHRKQWTPIGFQTNHRQIIPPHRPQRLHHSTTQRPWKQRKQEAAASIYRSLALQQVQTNDWKSNKKEDDNWL